MFLPDDRILRDMKTRYVLSFLSGAVVMLGFSTLSGSNLHITFTSCACITFPRAKWTLSKLGLAITPTRSSSGHNMKSVGYWVPEDAPSSQNLVIYILEHPSRQEAEKNWAASKPTGMEEGESRIGSKRATGGPHRPLLYGADQLFGA